MIVLSESKINELKNQKYKVYSKEPLHEGCECFCSSKSFGSSEPFCITSVYANNIKHENGRFFYTEDDLSKVSDWWPKHLLPIQGMFVACGKKRKDKIASNKCIVDVSGLPAFNGVTEDQAATNEDVSIHEYRFYLTLFNDYTIKQVQYERHNLYDAQFTSSKFDLPNKLQNSDFLKSKDFKMINSRRGEEENVQVGLIVKEDVENKYTIEYGRVYINMENQISIMWH